MREYDIVVIGGGLAGLMAAAAATKRGKKVTLLSLGSGTLTIGGGIVDVMGYLEGGIPAATPSAGLLQVGDGHPYKKIGRPAIEESIRFFKEICEQEGYSYIGNLDKTQWIPTAAGTLKPTCLVPKTMDTTELKKADKVTVLGFDALKDFYPSLIAKNFKKIPAFAQKEYEVVMVDPKLSEGRDVTALDVARWLDTEEGLASCIEKMRNVIDSGSVVIIPPVLGTRPDYAVKEKLEKALGCHFVETASVPPSITGLRLRTMLVRYLKKNGVRIVEQAIVAKSIVEDGKCVAVITEGVDRERTYNAKSFILANGGFYGGGLLAEPGKVIEPIFNLPVEAPTDHELWANYSLFSSEAQPFAKLGLDVDEKMRPLDANGKVLLNNVYVAGRNLRGYDFSFEKSGNGVAIASGYQAAMSV
ncbi:anaerobic glycerol-3-phosphate dehydrogenase subunit GlpB [Pelosinus sp. HCF1]|uniref:anaerobic glycerol-3-phosphate dehydrogenase subunit GlpB n=1 Tax=Pelosinus sp. HCF1 TaxID=1235479 RepID=UPI000318FFFC|nr:anaerobic glycerol-3-phosphate dehydrogenase subunit GlpB [Pelosinus sp. HCF1]